MVVRPTCQTHILAWLQHVALRAATVGPMQSVLWASVNVLQVKACYCFDVTMCCNCRSPKLTCETAFMFHS